MSSYRISVVDSGVDNVRARAVTCRLAEEEVDDAIAPTRYASETPRRSALIPHPASCGFDFCFISFASNFGALRTCHEVHFSLGHFFDKVDL